MKLFFSASIAVAALTVFSFSNPKPATIPPMAGQSPESSNQNPASRKIQAAILLDVSNSMDGLIEQAKAQLWNMVTTLGRAQCADKTNPQVEVALYEYGRSGNDVTKGYVKQLSSFTQDLDSVSKILFGLNTNGGDEYCGQVIFTSIDELKWDAAPDNYKVIFIAGNEDFLQGNVLYTSACSEAKQKGVIVNTIYCGDRAQGIKEHWNLAGECGNGSFTNIDQDAKEIEIPTPYDTTLIVLNDKLNDTYIGYGEKGGAYKARQSQMDQANTTLGFSAMATRANAKAMGNVYMNSTWDLVDASKADSMYFLKVDKKTLPDSLRNKTVIELRQVIQEKSAERGAIQQEILTANANRSKYIAAEKAKAANNNNGATLESAIEQTVKEQIKRFNMVIH